MPITNSHCVKHCTESKTFAQSLFSSFKYQQNVRHVLPLSCLLYTICNTNFLRGRERGGVLCACM